MMDEDVAKALELLEPIPQSKRSALARLMGQIRLALARGVTVAEASDCLLEYGVRMSPDQIRARLATSKATGRPPETAAAIRAAGPVSALRSTGRKSGRIGKAQEGARKTAGKQAETTGKTPG